MDRHPARHPLVYAGIVLACTVLGGIGGYYSQDYDGGGVNLIAGILFGGCLGLFLALLWSLFMVLADP